MEFLPDTLVISSGAEKGLAELGALEVPYQRGLLAQVKNIVGCSVGAILGLLLAIGLTPPQIALLTLQWKLFEQLPQVNRLNQDYALLDHSTVMDLLTQITLAQLRYLPTFAQLYQEKKIRLLVASVNLATSPPSLVFFDYLSHPDLSVLEAVKRSISIQPLFPPVRTEQEVWVDGALLDPFPLNVLDDGTHTILGVHTEIVSGQPTSFIEHMSFITSILVDRLKKLIIEQASEKVRVLTIPLSNTTLSDCLEQRLFLYYQGYFTGLQFCTGLKEKVKED